jgi:hypothetical protein
VAAVVTQCLFASGATIGLFANAEAAGLPDGRAYELISPPEKNGYSLLDPGSGIGSFVQVAPDGNTVKYGSTGAYRIALSNPLRNVYVATRTSTSWSTMSMNPPTAQPPTLELSNLAGFVLPTHLDQPLVISTEALAPHTPPGTQNLFLRNTDGSFELLTTSTPPSGQFNELLSEVGMSSDLRHVLFTDNAQLTQNAPAGGGLYEAFEGQLRLVSLLPDGVGTGIARPNFNYNPISPDGSRVFWQAPSDTEFVNSIYIRENGTSTIRASASQRTDCADHNPCTGEPEPDPHGPRDALLQWAAADGSRVLFSSTQELTNDAHTGGADNSHDLYAYNAATRQLTDLSVDTNPADAATGAGVQGVVGLSQDGSYIYFVADGQLVPGQGIDGQPNLYLWHAGSPLRYIVTLSAGDSADWVEGTIAGGGGPQAAYATPDGQHLVFLSVNSLTGYNNTDATTGQRDSEVFAYSAAGSQVTCASCDPSGARPIGSASIGHSTELGTNGFIPRDASDDGSRVFFNSPDRLVPGPDNGHVKVFEYEGGYIYLISTGTSSSDDFFADASTSGNDVFFTTQSQLVPQDTDTAVDLYDARVGGGLPAPLPPSSASCSGDGCQAASNQPPAFGSPSSAMYAGLGNVTPAVSLARPPSRSRLLARALHACRAQHNRRRRHGCEARARRRYASVAQLQMEGAGRK